MFKPLLARAGMAALLSLPLATPNAQTTKPHSISGMPSVAASLAATCAACHNTGGAGLPDTAVGGLNHLSSSELQAKLLAYKNDSLSGTLMPQLAKGYTDEQIQLIANHLGHQSKGQ